MHSNDERMHKIISIVKFSSVITMRSRDAFPIPIIYGYSLVPRLSVEGVERGFIVMRLMNKLCLWLSRMMILMVVWTGIPIR